MNNVGCNNPGSIVLFVVCIGLIAQALLLGKPNQRGAHAQNRRGSRRHRPKLRRSPRHHEPQNAQPLVQNRTIPLDRETGLIAGRHELRRRPKLPNRLDGDASPVIARSSCDEAIQGPRDAAPGLLRCARNDGWGVGSFISARRLSVQLSSASEQQARRQTRLAMTNSLFAVSSGAFRGQPTFRFCFDPVPARR